MSKIRKVNPRELTPKQIRACEGYLQGKSMRVALLDAGYSEMFANKQAGKWLKNRNITEYLRKRQKEKAEAARATEEYVQRKLVELIDTGDVENIKDAIKILDGHFKWREELKAKLKMNEESAKAAKQPQETKITIKYEDYSE